MASDVIDRRGEPHLKRIMRFGRVEPNLDLIPFCRTAIVPLKKLPHEGWSATIVCGPYTITMLQVPPSLTDLSIHGDHILLVVPLGQEAGLSVNGNDLAPVHLPVVGNGGTLMMRNETPQQLAIIAFERTLHDPRFAESDGSNRTEMRIVDPARLKMLRTLLQQTFRHITTDEFGSAGARIAAQAQTGNWLDEMLPALLNPLYRRIFSAPHSVQLMQRIDEYIEAHRGEAIYLQEITAHAGVSMRKLHNVLVAMRGLSFTRYLKLRRLWVSYRELLGSDSDMLIKTVALRNGFWHLGDFSREYMRQFGEMPSQTRGQVAAASDEAPSDKDFLHMELAKLA